MNKEKELKPINKNELSIADISKINYQETNRFNLVCKFDHDSNLDTIFINESNNTNKATYINNNINKMCPKEKKILLNQLYADKRVNDELMRFVLKYLTLDKKISTFKKCVRFVDKYLKKFHMKAGGFILEDTTWTPHNNTGIKYPLKQNEFIFENSIKRIHKHDVATLEYLDDLKLFFDRNIDTKKFSILLNIFNGHDELCWVIFKFEHI
jgi:hypothetical protein